MDKLVICAKPSGHSSGDLPLGGVLTVTSTVNDSTGFVELLLNKIQYARKMFSPCELLLHFSVRSHTGPIPGTLKNALVSTSCKVELYDNVDGVGKVYLARNYYVEGVAVTAGSGHTECVLKCFSQDRHLQEKKGCQAFTAKKFGSDIFASQLDKEENGMAGLYQFNTGRLLMMGYNSSKCYRDGHHQEIVNNVSTKKQGHDAELIHPYLVRYNESLYDFLARVSHKCGEFLYFEGGKLCLGLPEKTISHLIGDSQPDTVNPLCEYLGVNAENEDDSDSWSVDYVNGVYENSDSECCYDAEYTSDEYLYHVSEKDGLKDTGGWWIAYRALGTLFTGDTFLDGIANAGLFAGMQSVYSKMLIPSQVNASIKKNHIDTNNDGSSVLANPPKGTAQNLCNRFYRIIDVLEEKSLHRMVKMDFSNTYPNLQLGDDVKLCGGVEDWCLITCMNGCYSYENSACLESHQAEGVPVLNSVGIDELENVAVPAAYIVSHKVESHPREALVVKNDDPLRLNRVKVKYPWQKDDSDPTPWIRVAVPFAGGKDTSGGFTMTPEVGEHVVVDYYDLNIERPFVDGSFYFRYKNGNDTLSHSPAPGYTPDVPRILQTMDTHQVPQSIVSGNGHSISFLDMPDTSALSVLLPGVGSLANLCQISSFLNDNHRFKDVPALGIKGGCVMLKDGTGICTVTLSPDEKAITVKSDFGTVNMSAFTGIDISAPNGDVAIIGKNVSIEAGNNLSLEAGTNIQPRRVSKMDKFGFVLGGIIGKFATEALQVEEGIDLAKAFDLSLVRSIMEIVLRPVEGTLSIRSYRNTVITAGDGKATLPDGYLASLDSLKKHYRKSELGVLTARPIVDALDMACSVIDHYYDEIEDLCKNIHKLSFEVSALFTVNHNGIDLDNIEEKYRNLLKSVSRIWTSAEGAAPFPTEEKLIKENINEQVPKQIVTEIYNQGLTAYTKIQRSWNECSDLLKKEVLQNRLDKRLDPIGFPVKVDEFPHRSGEENYRYPFGSIVFFVTDLMKKMFVDRDNQNENQGPMDFVPGVDADVIKHEDYVVSEKFTKEYEEYICMRKKVMKRSAVLQILLKSSYVKMNLNPDNIYKLQKAAGEPVNRDDLLFATQLEYLSGYVLQKKDMQDRDIYPWTDVVSSLIDTRKMPDSQKAGGKAKAGSFFNAAAAGALSVMGGGGDYSFETHRWKAFPNFQKLINRNGISGPHAIAGLVSNTGGILFSKSKDKSLRVDENDNWDAYSNDELEAIRQKINSFKL